ncbi:MAG: hypothetical protein DSY55_02865 [Clostridia bacterium]|nr:MAG: hypothetical protein DSY55_02865 [Clostridia bacterium]
MVFGLWSALFWTAFFLIAIWWLSRQLAFFFMSALYLLTRSEQFSVATYAIFFLPGTVVHEFAHWFVANLLGVKTAGFNVLPKVGKKGSIQLGSVSIRGGNLITHTLIGMAPMLLGGVLTVWLSYVLVNVSAMHDAVQAQSLRSIAVYLWQVFQHQDAFVLLYLLFTISGSMFLSASDRAPILQMFLYLALVLTPLYFLGMMPAVPGSLTGRISEVFSVFASGLAVAVLVHLAITALMGGIYLLVRLAVPVRQ